MALTNLAEAIILQALEDMWDERYLKESITFFMGDGFDVWSCIAGLDVYKQYMILLIASRRLDEINNGDRRVNYATSRRSSFLEGIKCWI